MLPGAHACDKAPVLQAGVDVARVEVGLKALVPVLTRIFLRKRPFVRAYALVAQIRKHLRLLAALVFGI